VSGSSFFFGTIRVPQQPPPVPQPQPEEKRFFIRDPIFVPSLLSFSPVMVITSAPAGAPECFNQI